MKSRVLLYAFVIVAIVAFVAWIARNTYWDDVNVPMPLRGDAASNPFYSVQHLAESLGARTDWRKALGESPPTDAILALDHWNWSLIPRRREQLERWVEAGGRLVVDSSFVTGDGRFQAWSGLSRESALDKHGAGTANDDDDEARSQEGEVEVDDAIAAPAGACSKLRVTVPMQSEAVSEYAVCSLNRQHVLRSRRNAAWTVALGDQPQVLRATVGRGSVTMLNARAFTNRELLRADHGLLFVAATQLHPGDLLVLLSEEDHASLLGLIWKYGAPAVLLTVLLLGAALWANGARFGPPVIATAVARRSLAEQIVGTGRFTLRVGGGQALHAATVRALHEAASRKIAGYARMSAADRIARIAQLTQTDADALAETLNYAGARRARELKHAVELLERIRRRLLNPDA